MRSTVLGLGLLVLGWGTMAPAAVPVAVPVLAVMPLRDLSAGKPNIGAALRETLTSDLQSLQGLRVVEREAIDRVLREQSVDPNKALEAVLGVRVGTLIGASHLVTGAYQRQGDKLRVTARVIVVATGEIVGSTKVDGTVDRLLELQDQLSGTLLTSVGWKGPPPAKKLRPRITAHAIERFGDAALEPDTTKKKALLKESITESPKFSYAVNALASLEGRLGTYEAAQAATLSEREQKLLAATNDSKLDDKTRVARAIELFNVARAARRYHALLSATDRVKLAGAKEEVYFNRFVALSGLHRTDEAMSAGELFLHDMPGSPHFSDVETAIRSIADTRRGEAEGRKGYDKDFAEKQHDLAGKTDPPHIMQRDWAPCICARWNHQYNALMLDGCRSYVAKQGNSADPDAQEHAKAGRLFIILSLGAMGRFEEARREIADFRKRYPDGDSELDQVSATWPTD